MSDGREQVVHGSELGRSHRSVRRHLVEDHGFAAEKLTDLSDGAISGLHDHDHHTTWAYAFDLAHPFFPGRKLPAKPSQQ